MVRRRLVMDGSMASTATGKGAAGSARCIALVGPYLAGKTTLLEAILARTNTIKRQGAVADHTTVGDSSPEARAHGMSVELNIADVEFLGDKFTFIDCPGSVEFQHEADAALSVCDAAVIVSEPDPKRIAALQMVFKQIEDRGIPHYFFLNKIDTVETRVRDVIAQLQPASVRPLVLRQIPIWENGVATGFVDLALERAFVYRPHAPSEVVEMSDNVRDREKDARFQMLERLADYDDTLLEQLLSDQSPPRDQIFGDLAQDLQGGLICPVLLGSASNGNGIVRLLKALRHEVPFVSDTVRRLKLENARSAAHVIKTNYSAHGGKLSVARILAGTFADGAMVVGSRGEERIGGLYSLLGAETHKRSLAIAGETIAFGRLDSVKTGETVADKKNGNLLANTPHVPQPVCGSAITLSDRNDEVKLSAALIKLSEEDPSLTVQHDPATRQVVVLGHGEIHMRVTLERLKRKYAVTVERKPLQIAYRETIRNSTTARGRHKKQSGGHGQFGDVVLEIKPLSRGSGFRFVDRIVGGVVPRQYISAVETGVAEYLRSGPLGCPVVDLEVALIDGSTHSVDSSDMAFRQAGRLAMLEGMPQCQSILLEPIMAVEIAVPNDATARANGLISQRRGQIAGFDARPGWPGWDVIRARIPASEMDDLIVELRSATVGVGTFTSAFSHYTELTERLTEKALERQKRAAD
jgi:elongation factor G